MNNEQYYINRKTNRYKRQNESLKFWLKIYTIVFLLLVFSIVVLVYCIFSDIKQNMQYEENFESVSLEEKCLYISAEENNSKEDVFIPELTEIGNFRVTHYCPCSVCCGEWSDGFTASGTVATEGRTIAVDPNVIPIGSKVALFYDDGRICYYIAEDTGSAIKGNKVDVFIADHDRANSLGVTGASVYVVNEEVSDANDGRN